MMSIILIIINNVYLCPRITQLIPALMRQVDCFLRRQQQYQVLHSMSRNKFVKFSGIKEKINASKENSIQKLITSKNEK